MRSSDWSSDVCSSDLFAPTEQSQVNLAAENVPADHIHVTGNTVIDALQEVVARIESDAVLNAELSSSFNLNGERRLVLVTGHRSEERRVGKGWFSTCRSRWSPYA